MKKIFDYVDQNFDRMMEEMKEFCSYRSVQDRIGRYKKLDRQEVKCSGNSARVSKSGEWKCADLSFCFRRRWR